jgi:hypothetical protein
LARVRQHINTDYFSMWCGMEHGQLRGLSGGVHRLGESRALMAPLLGGPNDGKATLAASVQGGAQRWPVRMNAEVTTTATLAD